MIKFEEGVFYPGMFTDEEKLRIKRSNLWPVIMGLHHGIKGYVYCGKYVSQNGAAYVSIVTAEGFGVCMVNWGQDIYRVYRGSVIGEHDRKPLVKSKSARYIVNKLITGDVGSPADSLQHNITGCGNAVRRAISWAGERFADELGVDNVNDAKLLSGETQRMLVMYYMKEITEIANANMQTAIHSAHLTYQKRMDDVKQAIGKAAEIFNREKWLIASTPTGLICGALNPRLLGPITQYISNGSANFQYPDGPEITTLFRLYRDMDSIDPEFRDQLMGSWTMFKTWAEGHGLNTRDWANGMVPGDNQFKCYPDAGAASWVGGHYRWLVLDK